MLSSSSDSKSLLPSENGSSKHSANGVSNGSNGSNSRESTASFHTCGSNLPADQTLSPTKSESNSSFESMSASEIIESSTLSDVICKMRDTHYNIETGQDIAVEAKCKYYFDKDYFCEILANQNLCVNYPARIIIPVAVKEKGVEKEGSRVEFNIDSYSELVSRTPHARLRSRFAVPVILIDNKFICRSGTLTCRKSAVYEQSIKPSQPQSEIVENYAFLYSSMETLFSMGKRLVDVIGTIGNADVMRQFFNDDANVLDHLKIKHICDLMVEFRKMFSKAINVSSCELLHMDVYRTLHIEDMPFPGCEFFKLYKENGRQSERLRFDWSDTDVTRELHLSCDLSKFIPDVDFTQVKEWDLIQLTQNYLKIMLALIVRGKGSMLVHCISGWDRTPLFISLLRLSLWADGVIHKSLNKQEIAYLTVAYDWYLFGHNLPDRLRKEEEIMHFAFSFLPYINTDDYSITLMYKKLPEEEKKLKIFTDHEPGKRFDLNDVHSLVLDAYKTHIIEYKPIKEEPMSTE